MLLNVHGCCLLAHRTQSSLSSVSANTPHTAFQDRQTESEKSETLIRNKLKHLLQRAVRTTAQRGCTRGDNRNAAEGPSESDLCVFTPRGRPRPEPSRAEPRPVHNPLSPADHTTIQSEWRRGRGTRLKPCPVSRLSTAPLRRAPVRRPRATAARGVASTAATFSHPSL
ncbi:hypothetical protein SRHO_G00106220 [Serrasalmus rhombeus]